MPGVTELAALLVDDDALAAWQGAGARELWALAAREGVECLLAQRLQSGGRPPVDVSRTARDLASRTARDVLARATVLEELRRRELVRLTGAFADSGVRVLLMKGGAWAYTLYSTPILRSRLDTDLLVGEWDRDAAHRVLLALGYEPAVESVMVLASAQRHYGCLDAHGAEHFVDLHWRATSPLTFANALPFARLWPRSVPIAALGGARTLSDADALMLACLHRLAHHGDDSTLRWLMDIHLLAGGLRSPDWAVVVHEARFNGLSAVCARSLARARERFGTRAPAGVIESLAADRSPAIDPVFLGRGVSPLGIFVSDWRAVGTWAGRLRLLRDHLCPAPSYIRARYGGRHPQWALPLLYVHRGVTGLGRWLAGHVRSLFTRTPSTARPHSPALPPGS